MRYQEDWTQLCKGFFWFTGYFGYKQNVKKASENKLNSILWTFDSVVKLAKSSTLRHSKDDFTHSISIRTV